MDTQDFRDINFKDAGEWPVAIKVIAFVLLASAIIGAGYWFDTKDQYIVLEKKEKKEQQLRKKFEKKQAKAVNLEAYREQLADMEESFGAMLRQLPDKTEVAALLVDVSQTGLAAGLEFELFKPQAQIKKDFYAELPIDIKVRGGYHEFGEFISGLAALPRIVTIHNIRITKPKGGGKLILQATAKTYNYLDEAG